MSKEKEEPYKEDQALWDLNKKDLEGKNEAELKIAKEVSAKAYSEARRKRIDTQRQFIRVYQNSKDTLKKLYDDVRAGTTEPADAVKRFQSFVADTNTLTAERKG